mmetsp:Transcript_88100/g.233910  ORF Transcript_88100/g.233910 Transcript_88100/m.233910 type:complete len:543 (-) Transcript_88100:311-1939(-)|eukprot:CAMPEP_0171187700 /NCGR_PEP_ID=MMETSP0790-20130122/17455_1 /TAXON_ID=2925 /ORGANISM="Alexandrium catenella, Strain OF101" /LENGTH=542 /DNA_ID=CAMNT_0011652767 /DNA_START=59 /DNA_END=1687 /DNA_ORIENTATION=-
MARRPARGVLVLALAAISLLAWHGGNIALVEVAEAEKSPLDQLAEEAGRVVRFWEQPHNVHLSHGGFGVRSVSQGRDQWQLSVSENGDVEKPGAFLSQEGGKGVAYGFEYDSAKSRYSVAEAAGLKLKRVAVSAVSNGDGDAADVDWALHVEGDKGRHFSATSDGGSVVYDGSFGLEAPVAEGLAVRYAIDAKRRASADGPLPSWYRHGAGLSYASPVGNATVHVHQPNPDLSDAPLEYEARLKGEVAAANIKGSPTYELRAARDGEGENSYTALLKLKGPEGLTGGLTAAVRGGKPAVSAYGEYAAKRRVASGIEVGGDAKVSISPPGQEGGDQALELHPVGLTASADLGKLAPAILDSGSKVDLRARYKLGADMPALSASAKIKAPKLSALELAAEASVDDEGQSSGKLKVSGSARGVSAQYEATASPGREARHAAQVLVPAELKGGSARAFGRVYQSEADNGGRPRLQLGVQYDFKTDVAGRAVRVNGDSALYDSGNTLLGDDGVAWHDARLKRGRNSAKTLRARIEGPHAQSHKWLHQ